jgi:hypothetical protein
MNSPSARGRALVLSLGALGCASSSNKPPDVYSATPRVVVTSQTGQITETTDMATSRQIKVLASPDAVFTALAQVYSELNIPIGTLQTSSRRIGNTNFRVINHSVAGRPLSAFLDCGQSAMYGNRADQSTVTISILSTVVAIGDSTSQVTTELEGQARPLGESTEAIHCQSKGILEGRINVRVVTLLVPRGK